MVDGAEAHPRESLLANPIAQAAGQVGLLGIQQAVSDEQLRISMQRVGDIRIVPAEETRIDEHRVFQSEVAHFADLIFDGRFHIHALQVRTLGMMKREFRIEGPHFQMRVDNQAGRLGGGHGCRGLRQELSAATCV